MIAFAVFGAAVIVLLVCNLARSVYTDWRERRRIEARYWADCAARRRP